MEGGNELLETLCTVRTWSEEFLLKKASQRRQRAVFSRRNGGDLGLAPHSLTNHANVPHIIGS